MEWSAWSDCADDIRSRKEVIAQKNVGAGKKCPILQIEEEACVNCQVRWGPWGQCSNGIRSRSEVVLVQPEGAGDQCPELRHESEGENGTCFIKHNFRFRESFFKSRFC